MMRAPRHGLPDPVLGLPPNLPVSSSDLVSAFPQSLSAPEYERKKEEVADALVKRVEAFLPGLTEATVFREVGTPRTHRRFLNRCGPLQAL